MTLDQIIQSLNLTVVTEPQDFASITPSGGYTSDLLSCVMAGAKSKNIWVTIQSHANIIAVAALLDLAAIIITEGAEPNQATIQKANEEGIVLLTTRMQSYETVGRLWELGVRLG